MVGIASHRSAQNPAVHSHAKFYARTPAQPKRPNHAKPKEDREGSPLLKRTRLERGGFRWLGLPEENFAPLVYDLLTQGT